MRFARAWLVWLPIVWGLKAQSPHPARPPRVALFSAAATQRWEADYSQHQTPQPYAPLDYPASLYFGTGKGERTNLFVTNLGMGKAVAPALPWAGPGLVKIDAGVPGQPLQ